MSGTAALLECNGLALRAGARQLLEALNLTVHPGELWCVLGPNGSGKTTLLHTLAGLRPPAEGEVRWRQRPATGWPVDEAARLRGLLPQHLHDRFGARAIEVVLTGRHPHLSRWGWEDEADTAIALDALKAVGAEALADRDVMSLSGGERQRVAIATLLAQQVPLMMLDEPTAHLDLRHQLQVLQHLRALVGTDGRAAVVALHDLNLAARCATHALVLDGRGVAASGPAGDVMTEATLGAAFGVHLQRIGVGGTWQFVAS
jgi:iron complex transport system ATP-binding protein